MKKYAVYTRILVTSNDGDQIREIMVMNIESTSCGGAEHKILDIHSSIDNALAFDMEDKGTMKMFTDYISRCKCLDIKDFTERYAKLVSYWQNFIDANYEEIDDYVEEINEKNREMMVLENRIHALKKDIERLNGYCDEVHGEIDDFCKRTGMRNERSREEYLVGIA